MQSDTVNTSILNNGINKLLKILTISSSEIRVRQDLTARHKFMGEIEWIYIEGKNKDGENVKLNLVGKIAPVSTYEFSLEIKFKFQREIYIYKKVLNSFRELQENKNISEPFQAYPKCYLLENDNLVILENMKELGFKMYDMKQTLNFHQTSLVLKELGKLHALSFVLREYNRNLFDEIYSATSSLRDDNSVTEKSYLGTCKPICMVWFQNALNLLQESTSEYQKFSKLRDRFFEFTMRLDFGSFDPKYAVIGHCDCWIPNILFKHADPTSDDYPTEICLLDWQLSTRCSPAVDVSQVLYCCCDEVIRKTQYNSLITVYYESFSSLLLQFGLVPKKLFPYEIFLEHLKMFSVIGLCTAIATNAMTAYEVILNDIHGKLKANVNLVDMYSDCTVNEEMHKRIKGVILDHFQLGYDI